MLAYLPCKKYSTNEEEPINTILPDGIETIPRKFAINYRNKWMVDQSDYVVTYVKYSFGGASKFKKLAEKKNKIVINIAPQSVQKT